MSEPEDRDEELLDRLAEVRRSLAEALDRPFFVLATQNPIEQEGTYPLPEAQLDRFMLELRIG